MDYLIVWILAGIVFAEFIEYLNRKVVKRPVKVGAVGYLAQVIAWPFFLGAFVRGYLNAKK